MISQSSAQDAPWQTVIADQTAALHEDVRKVRSHLDPRGGQGRRVHVRRRHRVDRAKALIGRRSAPFGRRTQESVRITAPASVRRPPITAMMRVPGPKPVSGEAVTAADADGCSDEAVTHGGGARTDDGGAGEDSFVWMFGWRADDMSYRAGDLHRHSDVGWRIALIAAWMKFTLATQSSRASAGHSTTRRQRRSAIAPINAQAV